MLITGKQKARNTGVEGTVDAAPDAPGTSVTSGGAQAPGAGPVSATRMAQEPVRRTSFDPPHGAMLRRELTDFSTLALRESFSPLAGMTPVAATTAGRPLPLSTFPDSLRGADSPLSLGVAAKRYRDLDPTFSADVKRVAEAEALYGKENDPVETVELAREDPGPIQMRLRDLLQS